MACRGGHAGGVAGSSELAVRRRRGAGSHTNPSSQKTRRRKGSGWRGRRRRLHLTTTERGLSEREVGGADRAWGPARPQGLGEPWRGGRAGRGKGRQDRQREGSRRRLYVRTPTYWFLPTWMVHVHPSEPIGVYGGFLAPLGPWGRPARRSTSIMESCRP